MFDVFLYPGEASLNDVRLRNPVGEIGGDGGAALAGSAATTGQGQIIYGITSGQFISRSLSRRAKPGYWRR